MMAGAEETKDTAAGFVQVRGARQHNLRNVDVDIPRNAFVVFTGISGSGKSSLAFGTIFAEAQRRYFESIAPYARRLMAQLPAPKVSDIFGLPPAVALQQRRGEATTRSSVGTLTRLSNSLRMLFSRAGTYPEGFIGRLDSDCFSANTPAGACPSCHGIGIIHTVSEKSLVPDPELSIRQKAIAAWPGAWQGKNYQDILSVLGYDVDKPWKELSQKDRDWILFTQEKPVVTVHAIREAHRIQRPYQGTYMSARSYVLHTFGTTGSATLRKRVAQYMDKSPCLECGGKKLKKESLQVTFSGRDIAELAHVPLSELSGILKTAGELKSGNKNREAAEIITTDIVERIDILNQLGLDYLSLDRGTPTLSAGELQRLRLATQLKSGLFGVVYVLDEPSAGLHPADSQSLLKTLLRLKEAGNSLFVVEHELDLVRQADWIVDIGPNAGEGGGRLLYSGPVAGLKTVEESLTARFLFPKNLHTNKTETSLDNVKVDHLALRGVSKHNLVDLDVTFPLASLSAVTGVSGSGKSTLVSQVLAEAVKSTLNAGDENTDDAEDESIDEMPNDEFDESAMSIEKKPFQSINGLGSIKRLIAVDQKPIGRTPRSNLATYTGLFDHVRKTFAATKEAKQKGFNAGRFSFNVVAGRCSACEGEGFVSVELMFLPSVYAPCTVCAGKRYNEETLAIRWRHLNIAQVLDLTVDQALDYFGEMPAVKRALLALQQVGLGYLRLGQPATELSGGEAQRIRLATELQREQKGDTLYLLDEPTTGLHPADVVKLINQLKALVAAGNTVIVVEHDLDMIAQADWVIDLGPGAGSKGGQIMASGRPEYVAGSANSVTAQFLAARINKNQQKPAITGQSAVK